MVTLSIAEEAYDLELIHELTKPIRDKIIELGWTQNDTINDSMFGKKGYRHYTYYYEKSTNKMFIDFAAEAGVGIEISVRARYVYSGNSFFYFQLQDPECIKKAIKSIEQINDIARRNFPCSSSS